MGTGMFGGAKDCLDPFGPLGAPDLQEGEAKVGWQG